MTENKRFKVRSYDRGDIWMSVEFHCIDDYHNIQNGFPTKVIELHNRKLSEDLCEFLNKRNECDERTIELFFKYLIETDNRYKFYESVDDLMDEFVSEVF